MMTHDVRLCLSQMMSWLIKGTKTVLPQYDCAYEMLFTAEKVKDTMSKHAGEVTILHPI